MTDDALSLPALALRSAAILALAGVGGYAASLTLLPLPWLLGSLIAAALIAALAPARWLAGYAFPMRLRTGFVALIGVMIGTQVTPEMAALARSLPLTLGALALFVVLAHAGNIVIFRRVGGLDRTTAFYAGAPGGLMESLMLGEAAGADVRVLTIQQFLRIILVITLMPLALSVWIGAPVGSAAGVSAAQSGPVPAGTIGLILLAAALGLVVARTIRLPAAQLTGPLILSAAVTLSGAVDLHLPFWLIALAQVVIGASLGMRFRGVTAAMLRRSLGLSVMSVAFMLVLGAGLAALLTRATDIPFLHLLISFAPGGVIEMSVIALSLAANPALVSLHHVARILITVVEMSAASRWLKLR